MIPCRFLALLLPLLAGCDGSAGKGAGTAARAGAEGAMAASWFLVPASFRPRVGEAVSLFPRTASSLPGSPVPWTDLEPESFVARLGGEQWILGAGDDVRFGAPGSAVVALSAKASGSWLHAKTVIAVRGPDGAPTGPAAGVTARFGLTLEITPLMDPSALEAGSDLPLRVHLAGPGLGGAEVLAGREGDEARQSVVTGESGGALIRVDREGTWLVSVRHQADGQAHAASLLFEVGREGR